MSTEYKFQWNLPYEYDVTEPEIDVEFYFHPGNGKQCHPHDPAADPAVLEDITVMCGDEDVTNSLPEDVMAGVEDAAWDYALSKEPRR